MFAQVRYEELSSTLSGETLSAEIFVGRNYSSGEFWSLSEKFVTFARRKIRNLSYFMRTQYNLYISAPSKNYSSGEIIRRAKLFVGRNFRHLAKNSSLSPDKVSPDKVVSLQTLACKRLRANACVQTLGSTLSTPITS